MSVEAYKAVWDHFEGTQGQRVLMLALANRADEHGICWPSVKELMAKTRMSRSGIYDCLSEVRESGQLATVDAGGGRGNVTLRWLKLPGLDGDTSDAERRLEKGSRGRTARASRKGPDTGQKAPKRVQPPGLGTESKGSGELDRKGPDTGLPYIEETSEETSEVEKKEATPPSSQHGEGPSPRSLPAGEQPTRSGVPTGGKLSDLLADLVAENDPDGNRPNVTKAWLDAERLMIAKDGRDPEVAERLIRWCQRDGFWRANVRSMPKFREQYSQLFLQASRKATASRKDRRASRVEELVNRGRAASGRRAA